MARSLMELQLDLLSHRVEQLQAASERLELLLMKLLDRQSRGPLPSWLTSPPVKTPPPTPAYEVPIADPSEYVPAARS